MNMIIVPKGLGRVYLTSLWVFMWFHKKRKKCKCKTVSIVLDIFYINIPLFPVLKQYCPNILYI